MKAKTREGLTRLCKTLLHKYPGYMLSPTEMRKVHQFVLKRHPRYDEKVGAGIVYMSVETSCYPPHKCFFVHREDGSMSDFSYRKCLGLPKGDGHCDGKVRL